jgi:glycosyltransferase involved in cell wall biosynthesis
MTHPEPADSHFAVVIPVFNAEETLGSVIGKALNYASNVIVVDDGSTDGSAGVAEGFPQVTLLRHGVNRKKGAALQTGLGHARREGIAAVITVDADGQHDPDDIPRFLEAYRNGEGKILVGNRFGNVEGRPEEMPRLRYCSNRLSSTLISWVIGARVHDIQCGYRLYESSILGRLTFEETGFNFETEVVAKAVRAGIKVGNVPVRCIYEHGTEKSNYKNLADSWEIAKAVIRSRWGK